MSIIISIWKQLCVLLCACISLLPYNASAQIYSNVDDAYIIQHWQNKMYYNAGATGYESPKVLTLSGAYYDASDKNVTIPLTIHSLVTYEQQAKDTQSSFGMFINYSDLNNDVVGKYLSTALSYSYILPFEEISNLRVGLQAGIKNYDFNHIINYNLRAYNVRTYGYAPFLNAGLFYNSKNLYAGLSIKKIYQGSIKSDLGNGIKDNRKHDPEMNFMIGRTFFTSRKFQWNPKIMFLSEMAFSNYLQIDNEVTYRNKYAIGVSNVFSRNSTVNINAGLTLGKDFILSVNYSLPLGGAINNGIEITAKFKL